MPGKVMTFFRSHSHNHSHHDANALEITKPLAQQQPQKAQPRPSLTRSSSSPRSSQRSLSPNPSSEKLAKMGGDSHKRLSIPGLGGLTHKSSHKNLTHKSHAKLEIVMESPPLVFYGPSATSTGALMSGQMKVTVDDDYLEIDQLKMKLAIEWTRKKPFHPHCEQCAHQTDELTTWNFIPGPATLKKGVHTYPFSYLLDGSLPETTLGALTHIEYALKATLACKPRDLTKPEPPITLRKPLKVQRAILPTDVPRRSIRIFPPTNLTANVELPNVIHPSGDNTVLLRLDGVVVQQKHSNTHTHWRLKRINWRLEELQKSVSPACPKHAAKVPADGKKEVVQSDVRTIGADELKTGWKANYSGNDGSIEVEFPFSARLDSKPVCNMSKNGTEVTHTLVVELIVSEEFATSNRPLAGTPTGAARVLRMHFNINMTNRAGMGISWDEEAPPMYEDVPASPPAYVTAEVFEDHISDDGIDHLSL